MQQVHSIKEAATDESGPDIKVGCCDQVTREIILQSVFLFRVVI